MMPNSEHQPQVNQNLEELFDLNNTPVEQGKAWSALSDKKIDDIDDLLVNKLIVELILTSEKEV